MARKQNFRLEVVTIEFDGRIIVESFSVDKGLVTTFYGRDSKSTRVGGSLPAVIAKRLLHELAEKAKRETMRAQKASRDDGLPPVNHSQR